MPDKEADHIVICTKPKTIEEELSENQDPEHLDFWPVSNFPKRITLGQSRLFLADGEQLRASCLIEAIGEEEWQGKLKKVVYLQKGSCTPESGNVHSCAVMGGFRYCPECKKEEERSESDPDATDSV